VFTCNETEQEERVKAGIATCLVMASIAGVPHRAAAEWKPIEKVQPYSIAGASGRELYESIGARGPKLSVGMRTIAQTSFALTWTRKYETRGNDCVLAVAKPKLIITYVLPKPENRLSGHVNASWATFIEGVQAHEKVHGDIIVDMVRKIEAATLGLTVPADPKCRKIRDEMTTRLSALSQEQRKRSRDFDQVELSPGGNVHQLILNLVNGG
jgi:predicted secreted Zn-dependent protease